jgi:hypothetical protein
MADMWTAIVIVVVLAVLGAFAYWNFADFREAFADLRGLDATMKKEADLLETGEQATATVLKIQNTGMSVNDNPAVHLALEVKRSDREPYATVITTVVDIVALPRVQPGCTVNVRVNAANPEEVAVVL